MRCSRRRISLRAGKCCGAERPGLPVFEATCRAPCQFQSHMGALFALFRTAKHRAKPNIPRIRNRRAIFYLRYTPAVFAFVAKSDAGYGNRRSWCENIACGAKHIAYMNKYKHNIQSMRLGTLFLIQQLPVCCRKVEKQK